MWCFSKDEKKLFVFVVRWCHFLKNWAKTGIKIDYPIKKSLIYFCDSSSNRSIKTRPSNNNIKLKVLRIVTFEIDVVNQHGRMGQNIFFHVSDGGLLPFAHSDGMKLSLSVFC